MRSGWATSPPPLLLLKWGCCRPVAGSLKAPLGQLLALALGMLVLWGWRPQPVKWDGDQPQSCPPPPTVWPPQGWRGDGSFCLDTSKPQGPAHTSPVLGCGVAGVGVKEVTWSGRRWGVLGCGYPSLGHCPHPVRNRALPPAHPEPAPGSPRGQVPGLPPLPGCLPQPPPWPPGLHGAPRQMQFTWR